MHAAKIADGFRQFEKFLRQFGEVANAEADHMQTKANAWDAVAREDEQNAREAAEREAAKAGE